MFCSKCGKENNENNKFCTGCGAPITIKGQQKKILEEQTITQQKPVKGESNKAGKKEKRSKSSNGNGKVTAVIACVVVLLALVGSGAYFILGMQMKYQSYAKQIVEENVQECIDDLKGISEEWENSGLLDLGVRRELCTKTRTLMSKSAEGVTEIETANTEISNAEVEMEKYHLLDEEFENYKDSITNAKKAIESRKVEDVKYCMKEVSDAYDDMIKANDQYIDELVNGSKNMDTDTADKNDMKKYNEALENVNKILKDKDYNKMKPYLDEMKEVYLMYVIPENELDLSVQQLDVTKYPNVNLYLRVSDMYGENIENLDYGMFYIRKKNAKGQYIKQTVKKVTQMDGKEGLNINMVADVSGSMDGDPLVDAQNVMSEFIDSVQFEAGDMVALTSFSNGVYIEQNFTNNATNLKDCIDQLYTQDMTALYDALYTSVNKVASRSGAKCVIAFTDGADNYSKCDQWDVIDLANRYRVPVFIIGIGNEDYSEVREIAESTGGRYYNIDTVGDMRNIYEQIYREEKSMYKIQFEDSSKIGMLEESDIVVGYNSLQYGGKEFYQYTPYTLVSVDDSSLFSDGPEGTVEAYMRNFADAMTEMDYSYIKPYIKKGSSMEKSQKNYVQKGISEVLDSFEIVNVDYKNSNSCVVTTRESYYVQKSGEPLSLLTQQCKYKVKKSSGSWKIEGFDGNVKVLARIKYN